MSMFLALLIKLITFNKYSYTQWDRDSKNYSIPCLLKQFTWEAQVLITMLMNIYVYIYIYSIESGNSQTTAMSEGVTIKTLAVKKRRCRFK